MIWEIIAQFLTAFHSKGNKPITFIPFTKCQGKREFVVIKIGDTFILSETEVSSNNRFKERKFNRTPPDLFYDIICGKSIFLLFFFLYRRKQQIFTVFQQAIVGRVEHFARFSRQRTEHIVGHLPDKTVRFQQFIQDRCRRRILHQAGNRDTEIFFHQFPARLFHHMQIDSLCFGQMIGCTRNSRFYRRIQLFQQRKYTQTDKVTCIGIRQVRAVGYIR